jgi:hypothetical protein
VCVAHLSELGLRGRHILVRAQLGAVIGALAVEATNDRHAACGGGTTREERGGWRGARGVIDEVGQWKGDGGRNKYEKIFLENKT